MNASGCGNAARPQRGREEKFFRKIFRKVTGYPVDINVLDIHIATASDCLPGFLQPTKWDTAIDEEMEVGVPVLLKFENSDVSWGDAKLAPQIRAQFGEHIIQVAYGITLDPFRVKGESDESTEVISFGRFPDRSFVSLHLSRTTV